jgi:cytochrome c peroxidase
MNVRSLLASFLACALLALPANSGAHQRVDPNLLNQVKPRQGPPPAQIIRAPGDPLVEQGRQLFFGETFGGNGRTCGTCHRAERNFTIDAEFIRRLPKKDPLFVHETNPDLRELENAHLLRKFGLFLENLDGFDKPGVFRSAQHTLGLRLTSGPATRGNVELLDGALGWSGDGAPGTGTLREFAIGAVVQHFPKTLARRNNVDFRLPTEDELDALLAFQLSLGRQAEYEVDPDEPGALSFRDAFVSEGQRLFHGAPDSNGGTRQCGGCHNRAGSNTSAGTGSNRDTGANLAPNAPACLAPGEAPLDGGFGIVPVTMVSICGQTLALRGDGRFNSPSLIEAADTPPFFHNNIAATIEDAVRFYTTAAFRDSADGGNRAFVLSDTQIEQIGAFLRAINAVDNIATAHRSLKGAVARPGAAASPKDMALRDIRDAIDVLTKGPRRLFAATGPERSLRTAHTNIIRGRLAEARVDLDRARSLILGAPAP